VGAEPPVRGEHPAGADRDDVERDERDGAHGHLRPRRRNHAGVSTAATRVPHATIVQNRPMILYETNVSTSTALTDAATTASAAAYTIARRITSVSRPTRAASTQARAAIKSRNATSPATPVSASTRTYQPSVVDGTSYCRV